MRLLVCAATLALAGCASTTEIQTRHRAESDGDPASHILLAARSPEKDNRDGWEKHCADVLERAELEITRAHRVLPDWQEPGSEALENWVREHDAEAIVLADITGLLLPDPYLPEEDPATGEEQMRLQWTFYPGGARPEQPRDDPREEIRVEWIAPDGERYWAGKARTREARQLKAIARSQCKALGKTLAEEGLLPPGR